MNKPKNTPAARLTSSLNAMNEHILHWTHTVCDKIRPFIKPTIYTFTILLVATIAIWRTSLPYIDDFNRDYNGGYAFGYNFGRHAPSFLMYLLNMDFTLQNLSPLTQILAMLFVAIACVAITYVLCHKKIRYLPLTFSTLIAINPLALGCWMYQYDSPGMALSILGASLPILFWYKLDSLFSDGSISRRKRFLIIKFIVVSSLSLLLMWTSYQSSSGLLPLLVLTICFVDILRNAKARPTLLKALLYVIPYLIAAGLFLVIYNLPSSSGYRGYRDASATSISNLLPAIASNFSLYISTTWQHLNGSWRILVIAVAISFVITSMLAAKKKNHLARNGILSIVYLIIALPLSYGAYLILSSPASQGGASATFGRTAIGLGFMAALICMAVALQTSIIKFVPAHLLCLPGLCLFVAFIAYNTAFANAYDDQLRYIQFRAQEVVEDIADIYPNKESVGKKRIAIYGPMNSSGEMTKLVKAHPLAKLIVNNIDNWLYPIYFGKMLSFDSNIQARWYGYYNSECASYPIRNTTYYHTIREKDNGDICVYLK